MKNPQRTRGKRGFALIVTLTLMILLTVVAVGLLTLSTISLRSTSQGAAQSIANGNARLAVMLALGDLQKSLGPDQSVSAPASSVFTSAARPRLTGAWTSTDPADYWHWIPTAGGSPSYDQKKARFSRWLVSSPSPADAENFNYAGAAAPGGINSVVVVGSSTQPVNDSQGVATTVVASKVKVVGKNQPGKLGWAVFDESTKAGIDLGDPATKQDRGTEIASRGVPPRFHADALDSKLLALKTPTNLISMETAKVLGGSAINAEISQRFHDFTTGSVGLLTNTADGGLKTDLTSLFEPDTLPANAFPTTRATGPYPMDFTLNSGALKWGYLRDHYRKYKFTTTDVGGEPGYDLRNSKVKDLVINRAGLLPSPDYERLLPVIAKLQIFFSVVSHYAHIGDRQKYLNERGGGYTKYAVPHLAYDPVITLYNPYDVAITLAKVRVRIWDPPVGFRFTKVSAKGNARYRGEDFQGLARFQIKNQYEANARRCFTLVLNDGTTEAAGSTLKLKPGEVKVFSARIQKDWTWAYETASEYTPKSFFDWDQGKEFGNRDNRTNNDFGVEAVPGFDSRAGLQTDHLATNNRSAQSKYDFESGNDGFVYTLLDDQIIVDCRPQVTSGSAASKQFQVDILAGTTKGGTDYTNPDQAAEDRLRSYQFTFSSDPAAEMSANPAQPVITKNYKVRDILQAPTDKVGLKKPFAMLEMTARTTKEVLTDSKPWLYNNPVIDGGEQNSSVVGLTNQSYDIRLIDIDSFKNFPDGIAIDSDTGRGYFGAYGSLPEGSSFVNMLRVPVTPAASLGDLIPSNLAGGSALPRVVHPFGNSRAHPLIPAANITQAVGGVRILDHSYLLNDGLWDAYYFSSLTDYVGGSGKVMPSTRSLKEVVLGMMDGSNPPLNNRLMPVSFTNTASKMADEISSLSDLERSRQLARFVAVERPFNLNSTSVDAWSAALLSLRDRDVNGLALSGSGKTAAFGNAVYENNGTTPFVRASKPLTGASPASGLAWAGYRALTDGQVTNLAKLIVEEIRKAGVEDSAPSFSLGEFVNRRPGSDSSLHSMAGILQAAIDRSDINAKAINDFSKPLSPSTISAKRKTGVKNETVMSGNSAEGAPSMITQGDLMQALASVATVRGDTFKIRGYGEATAADGTTVIARAWCETVVQRVPEFVSPKDVPETAIASLTSEQNKTFGRRFNVVSFRWLKETEL